MLDQITPLILTYNEAANLQRTMSKLTWARDIVVVDSFSDDATTRIASSLPQTRIVQRIFDTHQSQWSFGLNETGIKTEWVLALDADYVLSDELVEELKTLTPPADLNGYSVDFIYCLNGKKLRSGIYPSVTVLYRTKKAKYEQDGHTQRVHVEGHVGQLHSKILHDDRKPLRRWLSAQAKYAELEARKLATADESTLSLNDRIRTWRVAAPLAVPFYCLILRGGILDGLAGFYYAFQRGLAELMLSLYLFEHSFSREQSL